MVDPTADYGLVTTIPSIVVNPASLGPIGNHFFALGDGSGSISVTSTSYVDVQAGLDATLTVALGYVAMALFMAAVESAPGQSLSVGISIDGATPNATFMSGNYNNGIPLFAMAWLLGDGSSHTFKPRCKTGGGTATIFNSGELLPSFAVLVTSTV